MSNSFYSEDEHGGVTGEKDVDGVPILAEEPFKRCV